MGGDPEVRDGNIYSFADEPTENMFFGKPAPNSPVPDNENLHDNANTILNELHDADSWKDLERHGLDSVSGESDEWYELKINVQYRIYFEWDSEKGARHVQAGDHL